VRTMPSFVYDEKRSGASIAWEYFHPGTKLPHLLYLIQEGDLYHKLSDEDHAMVSYVYAQPRTFAMWDTLMTDLEEPTMRAQMAERGRIYQEQFQLLVDQLSKAASLVSFEGYEVAFVEAPKMFTTPVGARLNELHPPFTIIAHARPDSLRVSMRSISGMDVSVIARKYGGNGHPNAAAFSIPWGDPLPWKLIGAVNS
jgi:oligoribonuclease NrnB/cAMP/cGMP phosphodiesterase (DHH superfamily)